MKLNRFWLFALGVLYPVVSVIGCAAQSSQAAPPPAAAMALAPPPCPAVPPPGPPPPAPAAMAAGTPVSRSSHVRTVLYGPQGEVQGFALSDGMAVSVPPDLGQQLRSVLNKDAEIQVSGQQQSISGETEIFAQSVTANKQTFTAAAPPAGGPAGPPPPPAGAMPPPSQGSTASPQK